MKNRPLSPHLQIYKPQITSILSILHRFTGAILCLSIPLIVMFIYYTSQGEDSFTNMKHCFSYPLMKLGLIILGFSVNYHALNGVRHLFWDFGYGFSLKSVNVSGWFVVIVSLCLTYLMWGML